MLLYGPYNFFDSILPVQKGKSHNYFTDRTVSELDMTLTGLRGKRLMLSSALSYATVVKIMDVPPTAHLMLLISGGAGLVKNFLKEMFTF